MADLSSCFTCGEEEKGRSAFAHMSVDSLKELMLQLSIEVYRKSLATKKNDEVPFLETPEYLTPFETPRVMLSDDEVLKSSTPKDSWPSSPTDTLGKSQNLVVHFLKENLSAMKQSVTRILEEVVSNQISTPTLNLMNVELTFCLENMKILRQLLIELPHLKTSDKYKINKSYYCYADSVKKTKQEIHELLVSSQQKGVDTTQNTQVGTSSEKKQGTIPVQKYHCKLLSESISKKMERKRYNEECRNNAEVRHRSEVEKLLVDQYRRFETKLQQEVAKKEEELRTYLKRPLETCQKPPAQVNDTRLTQVEYRITLTPEQFTIWIEMQREYLTSRIQTQTQASMNSTENTLQNSSQQINIAKSDVLHYPERSLETEVDSVTQPKYKDLVCSTEVCEIPEEKSVLLFSGRDGDENSATNADEDGSREDKADYDHVVLSVGETQSRFMYAFERCTKCQRSCSTRRKTSI